MRRVREEAGELVQQGLGFRYVFRGEGAGVRDLRPDAGGRLRRADQVWAAVDEPVCDNGDRRLPVCEGRDVFGRVGIQDFFVFGAHEVQAQAAGARVDGQDVHRFHRQPVISAGSSPSR